jgi:hypothetical protein
MKRMEKMPWLGEMRRKFEGGEVRQTANQRKRNSFHKAPEKDVRFR